MVIRAMEKMKQQKEGKLQIHRSICVYVYQGVWITILNMMVRKDFTSYLGKIFKKNSEEGKDINIYIYLWEAF